MIPIIQTFKKNMYDTEINNKKRNKMEINVK